MKSYSFLLCCFLIFLVACQKETSFEVGNGLTPPAADSTVIPPVADSTIIPTVPPVTGTPATDYSFYYQATIDGTNYKEVVTETNGYEAGSGAGGVDDVVVSGSINLTNTTVKGTTLGIGKGTIHNYLSTSNAVFKNFFTPGTYPYSPRASAGVAIDWTDKNGVTWSTDAGSADQTGSVFKITAVEDFPSFNAYYIKVTVEFNCKIYNDAGESKVLTNGKAVVAFGKI